MNSQIPPQGAARLTDWGVIRADGADAATFLQGQLTNDVLGLGPSRARLAGFCSAKGRLQASFIVWQPSAETFLLACSTSILAATLKRLSMFVLRARCKLRDASTELPLVGVSADPGADGLLAGLDVWAVREEADRTLVRLADANGMRRGLLAGPLAGAIDAPPMPLSDWRWLELHSGIATIEAATVDRFVPQMLNYELVGAIDFRKGCYPGQEVVARSQYRGTIKRRTVLFDCAELPVSGQEVFHSDERSEPAGVVANAAPKPNGGASALVEVKLALLDGGSFHVGSADGAALVRRELPYALDADVTQPA